MNKIFKRILIGTGIAFGLVILAAVAFFLIFFFETRGMSPSETSRINDTVFAVKNKFVNAFIFKGNTGYFMIDAGIAENSFKQELEKLGIRPDQVNAILFTHTDGDHIGAAGLFNNCKFYLHKDEEQMINGQKGKFFFMKTKWKYGPYTLFNSDDTLTIDGIKVRIFHTPGHTPGSCCFLIGKDYLATGDNLAYKNGKFGHFIDFFNMNTKEQEESIKTLPDLDSVKFILTGHFGVIRH